MASGPTIEFPFSKAGPFWMGDPGDGVPAIENASPLRGNEPYHLRPTLVDAIKNNGWGGMLRRFRTLPADQSWGWFLCQGEGVELQHLGATHIFQPEEPGEYDVFPHDWRSWTIVREGLQGRGVGYLTRLATRACLLTGEPSPNRPVAIVSSITEGNTRSRRIDEIGVTCLGRDPSDPENRFLYVSVNLPDVEKYIDGVTDSGVYHLTKEKVADIREGAVTLHKAITEARKSGLIVVRDTVGRSM